MATYAEPVATNAVSTRQIDEAKIFMRESKLRFVTLKRHIELWPGSFSEAALNDGGLTLKKESGGPWRQTVVWVSLTAELGSGLRKDCFPFNRKTSQVMAQTFFFAFNQQPPNAFEV